MLLPDTFDELIQHIRSRSSIVEIDYPDAVGSSFRHVVAAKPKQFPGKLYGVYIVWGKTSNHVLYIGKSGTLDQRGEFQGQDVFGRLGNVKGNDVKADRWFAELSREQGPLHIECVPLDHSLSPAFVEAALLQSYLNAHHCLPCKNKCL